MALKQNVLLHNFLVTFFSFQQRMCERGEEPGRSMRIEKTNVSLFFLM